MEKLFSYSHVEILGGDTKLKNLEEWEESVSDDNAVIIGYKNLEEIINVIPSNYVNNLQGGINYLEAKYSARKNYIDIYNKVRNLKAEINFNPNLSQAGHCEKCECPKIRVEEYECKKDGKFFSFAKERINKSYDNIIVGWKIIDRWNDGTNGKWKVNFCPLLSYSIDINFVSKWFRGESFLVEIYIMEMPD